MTPREAIRRNLERDNPPRIGMDFDEGRMNDFCFAGFSPPEGWQQKRWTEGGVEYYTDEWGNVWHRSIYGGRGGEVFQPALDDWAKLKDYELPDMDNPKRYEQVRRRFAQETERYRVGFLPGFPFAICRYLRKMEVGICCTQFDQPALYGLERLSAKMRELGLCLYSPVDIQRVLPTGDRERIEREAHRMVDLFAGGFIAKNYPDLKGIGVQPEWDEWAYRVFLSYARPDNVL